MTYLLPIITFKELLMQFHVDFQSINQEEIHTAIAHADIFEQEESNLYLNNIRKIAYLITNPEYLHVSLEIHNSDIYIEDLCQVIAIMYNKSDQDMINISIEGEQPLLLESFINSTNTVISQPYKASFFSWEKIDNLSSNNWSNIDFVSSQFFTMQLLDLCKCVDDSLWSDPLFLNKFFSHSLYKPASLPLSILYKESIFDFAINDLKNFTSLVSSYLKLFELTSYTNPLIKLEEENITSFNFTTEKIINEGLIIKSKMLEVLNNKETILLLMDKTNYLMFYRFCNKNLQYDEYIINALFVHGEGFVNVEKYLPHDLFKNENILMRYLSTAFPHCIDVKGNSFIYNDWIDNKEKVLKYLQIIPMEHNHKQIIYAHPINRLFKLLNSTLLQDNDIITAFVEKSPILYESIPNDLKESPSLLLTYVQYTTKYNLSDRQPISFISNAVLEKLTESEIVIVLEQLPELFLTPVFPNKWKDNLNVLCACATILQQINLSDEQKEALSNDIEKSIQLVKSHPLNIKLLNKKTQQHPLIVFEVIKKNATDSYFLKNYTAEHIPQLWCSKAFCLSIIDILPKNSPLLESIPKQFWNDMDFVLSVAHKVDKEVVSRSIFVHAPPIISEIIHAYKEETYNIENLLSKIMLKSQLNDNLSSKKNSIKKKKI